MRVSGGSKKCCYQKISLASPSMSKYKFVIRSPGLQKFFLFWTFFILKSLRAGSSSSKYFYNMLRYSYLCLILFLQVIKQPSLLLQQPRGLYSNLQQVKYKIKNKQPMKYNPEFSTDEANQFMSNNQRAMPQPYNEPQSGDEMQKMFQVFQKMATDPALFMKMMSAVRPVQSEHQQRRREFLVEQHKYRNHETSPRRKDPSPPISSKQSRRKGTSVLAQASFQQNDSIMQKYLPSQSNKPALNQPYPAKQQPTNFDDIPIKSNYMANQQKKIAGRKIQPAEVPKQVIDDDRPIKPAKGYAYETDLSQSQMLSNSRLNAPDPSKYIEAEERPIKGIQGDFKNHIMQQQGFPISEYPDSDDNENEQRESKSVNRVRTFLKKGSRQHLSSAAEKSVPKSKKVEDMEESNMDLRQTQKTERSISQNRVLGRKSVSSKSIAKSKPPVPRDNYQKPKKTLQPSSTTPKYESTEPARPSRIAQKQTSIYKSKREEQDSPSFQLDTSMSKKPKKKNIFQESSSDEQFVEQTSSNNQKMKTQVIPGVFLTKKELHLILTKHRKTAPERTSTDESKIQQLKKKYVDLCNILSEQREAFAREMQKEKEEFEAYKQAQIAKIKNEKKVQQRNLLNSQKNKEKEKQREEVELLRKTLEKQRQQFRHKEKNHKIMVQKYKKLAEEAERRGYGSTAQLRANQAEDKLDATTSTNKHTKKNKQQAVEESNDQGMESNHSHKFNESMNKKTKAASSNSYHSEVGSKNSGEKLPNYSDLKKQNPPKPPKNNKYEYYEQQQNVQTVKAGSQLYKGYDNQDKQRYKEQNYEQQEPQVEDEQQVVEYNSSMKLSDLTKIPLSIKMVTEEMIENLFRYETNPEYIKYLELTSRPRNKIHTSRNPAEKKTTNIYADGGKEIIFENGVRKQYFSNGYSIIYFVNGDIKQKLSDDTVLYFYKEKEVDQITLTNKINIFRFDNNQVEFHFEDKTVQIRHPDGTFKVLN